MASEIPHTALENCAFRRQDSSPGSRSLTAVEQTAALVGKFYENKKMPDDATLADKVREDLAIARRVGNGPWGKKCILQRSPYGP